MSESLELAGLIKGHIDACNFECIGFTAANNLVAREEVRDMCSANLCRTYNKNWCCPPACGSIERMAEQISSYSNCYVVQTVVDLEDEFDIETMLEAAELHNKRMYKLAHQLRNIFKERNWPEPMLLAAGGCTICPVCNYPNPCRYPGIPLVSMEAAGLVVSEVCVHAGIPYNHGEDRIAYTGCILYTFIDNCA